MITFSLEKRNFLSTRQKLEIIHLHQQYPEMSQTKLSEFVSHLFGQKVNRSIVARTIRHKERFLDPKNVPNLPRPKIAVNLQQKVEILRLRDEYPHMSQKSFIDFILRTIFSPDEEICSETTIRRVLEQRDEILQIARESQKFSMENIPPGLALPFTYSQPWNLTTNSSLKSSINNR